MSFNLLPAALGMSIIVALVAALVLFYVQHLQKQADAARYWAWAFLFIALRHCCNLLQHQVGSGMGLLGDAMLFFYAIALWRGSSRFAGVNVSVQSFYLLGPVLLLWLLLAKSLAWPFWLTELPVYGFAASLLFLCAAHFRRLARSSYQAGYLALSLVMLAKGLHLLDYPFLRTLEWIAPIGFAISSLLDGLMAALLLLASLLRQLHENQLNHQTLLQENQAKLALQEQALEKQTLFEQIFESVPDALLICREDNLCIQAVNQYWHKLSGLSATQTTGQTLTALGVWQDQPALEAQLPNLLSSANSVAMSLRDRGGWPKTCAD